MHAANIIIPNNDVRYAALYRLDARNDERFIVVGLTGGIATGKSTVSKQLKSFGIPVVDADVIARLVVEPGTPALAKIVKHFGEDILLPDGTLDRPKLGSIVFNDEARRKVLNGIVHPAVWRAIFWEVATNWLRGKKICVLDVPLLIEGGLYKWVAKVVVVYWYVSPVKFNICILIGCS